jgi:hypothetical protein
MDGDELVRRVDLSDQRSQRQAVTAEDEDHRGAALERPVESLLAGDRGAARIGGHALNEDRRVRRGVGHQCLLGTPGA